MPSETRTLAAAPAIAVLMLLGGCAMQSTAPAPAPREGSAAGAGPAAAQAVTSSRAAGSETADATAYGSVNAIAGVLAERRRSDYPEIEIQAAGFTITEQVRVAGSERSDYEQALVLLRQDRLAEGIALLEQVTAAAPDATAPWIDLGIAYRRAGELEASEAALDNAALLSPDHPIVHNELGILYRQTGRFGEARASYERALGVFADFHYARRNLAVLCDLYLADLDCALEHYRAYLEAAGEDPEVEIWLADIENRLGNREG